VARIRRGWCCDEAGEWCPTDKMARATARDTAQAGARAGDLTTLGTSIEMASRLLEATLLALAALAVRGRIER
jgi:hypothetical protein